MYKLIIVSLLALSLAGCGEGKNSKAKAKVKIDYSATPSNVVAQVPTPALLPGLIVLGLKVWKKKTNEG